MSLHPIKSAAHAEKYFEHDGGYYTADRQADGSVRDSRWGGEIARRTGMDGQAVQAAEFALALNGVGPGSDPSKPVGSAGGRGGQEARRAGWDFNISAPKSISLAALFDKQVVEIFDRANAAACRVLEREADCRITRNGSTKVERTGALLIASFTHWNTRTNDVSLHTHNIVMNMTTGPDGNYRALESKRMHKAQAEARTTFYQVLGKGLERAGYEMRWVRDRTGRVYPEVASVTRAQVRAFSKRQTQIHAARERLQAKDPSLSDKYLDKAAYHAGRASKQHINLEEQKDRWRQEVVDAGITFSRTTEMQQQIKNGAQYLARETQLPQHIKRIGEGLRNDAEAAIPYEHFNVGKPATPRMVAAVEKIAAEKGIALPKDHTDLGVARHFLNTHGKRSLPMIAEPRGGLRLVPDSESVDRADDAAQRHELAQDPSLLIGERSASDAQAQDLESHQARDLDEFARTQPEAPSADRTEQEEEVNHGGATGSAAPEQEQGARADGQEQTRSQERGADAGHDAAGDKENPKADSRAAQPEANAKGVDWDTLTRRLEQVGVLGFERDVGQVGKLPATEKRIAELRAVEVGKDFAARSAARAERLQLERFMATHEGRLVEIRGRLHAASGSPRTIGNFAVSTLTAARGEREAAALLTRGDLVLGAADYVASDPSRQLGAAMRELGVHHFDDRVGQVGDLKATEARLAHLRSIEANKPDTDGRKYSAEQVDRAVAERAAIEMFMKRNEGRLIEVDGRLHAFEKAERLAAGFTSAKLIRQPLGP